MPGVLTHSVQYGAHWLLVEVRAVPHLQGYKYYGFNRGEKDGATGIWYREWAPGARVSRTPVKGDRNVECCACMSL